MNPLLKKYKEEVIPQLEAAFGYKNAMAVPKITSVTINVGLGSNLKDAKYLENVTSTLTRISGQKPVSTKARKSIAGFKIREGMVVGVKVTLRGARMYDFLYKLLNVGFPRVRDFWGISDKNVDRQGNLSFGFKEHIIFPEIKPEEVDRLHGLQVIVTSNSKNAKEGTELYRFMGFPFKVKENKK